MSSTSDKEDREKVMETFIGALTTATTTDDHTQTFTDDSSAAGTGLIGGNQPFMDNGTTFTTWPPTPPLTEIDCPLPKDVLERMLVKGMANSKGVLQQKVKEAFEKWCETGKIDVSVFPVLLAAAMISLDLHKETDSGKQKSDR